MNFTFLLKKELAVIPHKIRVEIAAKIMLQTKAPPCGGILGTDFLKAKYNKIQLL